jgi:serine protease Do
MLHARSTLSRVLIPVVLLATGLVAGLTVSGRVVERQAPAAGPPAAASSATPAPQATPQAAQPSSGAAVATAGPDFTRVAAQTVKAVANISAVQVARRTSSPFDNDPFFRYFFGENPGDILGRERYQSSLGSGVIISPDGYVITNNHVVGENVREVSVAVGDQREVRATIVGLDPSTDLALLKVEARNLPVIPWGDSSKLKVAEWVLAVGNPFSLNQTVTLGIVSALGRANVGIAQYEDFIQTDAAINPGNSGGALINARGELVGINTAIFSQSGGYQGVGFAVPSNLARRVVDDLIKFGKVRRGSIGYVSLAPLTTRLADELRAPSMDGLVVMEINRYSSAYESGLRPGDIVMSVNGKTMNDVSQLVRTIADSPVGSSVSLEIIRDGRRTTLRVPVEQDDPRRRRGRG